MYIRKRTPRNEETKIIKLHDNGNDPHLFWHWGLLRNPANLTVGLGIPIEGGKNLKLGWANAWDAKQMWVPPTHHWNQMSQIDKWLSVTLIRTDNSASYRSDFSTTSVCPLIRTDTVNAHQLFTDKNRYLIAQQTVNGSTVHQQWHVQWFKMLE